MSDLAFLRDLAIEQHRIRYAQDSSQLAPMVFLCRNNIIEGIAILDFKSLTTKRESAKQIKQIVRSKGYDATVLSSEAWMLWVDTPEDIRVRPRDSERRIEVLMIEARNAGGAELASLEIERDWSGKFTGFKELDMAGSEVVSQFDFFA